MNQKFLLVTLAAVSNKNSALASLLLDATFASELRFLLTSIDISNKKKAKTLYIRSPLCTYM